MTLRSSAPPTVLVIEDDAVIGLGLAETVRSLGGVPLGPAVTGAEAIRLAAENEPDLIISDLRLADGDSGLGAVRAIRSFDRDVPVVFLTGHPELLDDQTDVLPAVVIAKPAEPHALEHAITTALRRRPARKTRIFRP